MHPRMHDPQVADQPDLFNVQPPVFYGFAAAQLPSCFHKNAILTNRGRVNSYALFFTSRLFTIDAAGSRFGWTFVNTSVSMISATCRNVSQATGSRASRTSSGISVRIAS